MMYLRVPLSVGAVRMLLQLTLPRPPVFCCRVNPVEGEGQEIMAVLVGVIEIESNGEPGVCTTERRLQKPPVMEY